MRWWQRRPPAPGKLAQCYDQWARQLSSGVPLEQALDTLVPIAGRKTPLGRALLACRRDLADGLPLPQALARQPHVFDAVAVAVIDAACHTGNLPAACTHLHMRAQSAAQVRTGLRKALAYPMFVLLSSWLLMPLPLLWTAGPGACAMAVGSRLAIAVVAGVVFARGLPLLLAQPRVRSWSLRVWAAVPVARLLAEHRRLALVFGALAPEIGRAHV